MQRSSLRHTMDSIERSFGVIPIRDNGEILLIQDHHGNWGFPKGHFEEGETPQESAQRELFEETSLQVIEWIDSKPLISTYTNPLNHKKKIVQFFVAKVEGEVAIQAQEIQDFIWLPLDELEDQLTFEESKALIQWIPTN